MKLWIFYLLFLFGSPFSIAQQIPYLDKAQQNLPPSEEFYIFIDKEANALSLRSVKNPQKILKAYTSISGLNAGDKIAEGDRKTPEGIYVTQEKVSANLLVQSVHGPAGITLDYPNPVDRINRQTGSGIWIHGVKENSRLQKRFDTRGCVAIANENILKLVEWFVPNKTVVVIVNKESKVGEWGLQAFEGALGKRLKSWAAAWSSQMMDDYIGFYHPEFVSSQKGQMKMTRPQWKSFKNSLNKRNAYINVEISSVKVFKHPKYWMTEFVQTYESSSLKSITRKRLYWVGAENNPQIISEVSLGSVRAGL